MRASSGCAAVTLGTPLPGRDTRTVVRRAPRSSDGQPASTAPERTAAEQSPDVTGTRGSGGPADRFTEPTGLRGVLGAVQVGVPATAGEQLVVRAPLDDPAPVHH